MMAFAAPPKPRRSINRQTKRSGAHHKHDQKYIKHYWPYLPMALIIAVGLFANGLWARHPAVLGDSTMPNQTSLLSDTNAARQANHLSDLAINQELNQAAQSKANDMIARNYWSHDTPDGVAPWEFISNTGYSYQTAGENLAYGFSDSQQVLNAWLNSPEHRANVLGKSYTQVGFAVAEARNYVGHGPTTLIVAMYARPGPNVSVAATQSGGALQSIKGDSTEQRSVARIEVMNPANAGTAIGVLLSLAAIGLLLYVLTKHSLAWHRVLNRGEKFVLRHPMLDILGVLLVTAAFVLSQSAGFVL